MRATDKVIQKNQNTAKKSKIGYKITKICTNVISTLFYIALKIKGPYYVGAPTCADDVVLAAHDSPTARND